ncbi:uncharacterized protein LOC120140678 isoform X1 [Hibiscus syriacus]|uniref:uncharacterized protein LOC120140678 isoform X1 n=1 Tax=Hibiscus syriacus TaxID=106335 RepID=UPI00192042C2|nr:uncharacterized protein LOC120140678 isoform X1 [Hibiscus syriacus]
MGRRLADSDVYRFTLAVLFLMAASSCFMSYYRFSLSFKGSSNAVSFGSTQTSRVNEEENVCCRGIEHLELWGDAVKWGSDFKLNSSKECCEACKEMCKSDDGPCLCDSWVFCGDKVACGSRFGECWLKKQNDILDPDRRDSGDMVMWTSGIIFGKGEGIVKLNTEYGGFHVKLLPECAPYSVVYILELLSLHHCAGCQFYRAESRGNSWDPTGNHIEHASFGPPHALIQGTVEAQGTVFKDIPPEACPTIRGGSVAWVGSGPEFFISLAKHNEWRKAYTVFGYVLPEDMDIVEKISQLPTIPDVWSKVKVSVLERPVPLRILRTKKRP